ncbi:MAG: DNA cytosine methyltransferase [Flavobacteriales bacterium]|nr:DNA cytosine methyltransferase [Crocinitomicaceae bacterium]NBX80412.1 DNA cytosine methyltransferase [Flavobacteriales bacterium]NCA21082.1 DNA cytosine methyltransferase [Crocinitomicaceae bacterium]
MKYNVIDLFAGCGGLSDGFEQTHLYETLACVEWEKEPCKTLANRLKKKWNYENAYETVFHFDIQRTDELINGWRNDPVYGTSHGLKSIIDENKGIDVVIGGPPCQAYSIAGRIRDENGMNDDYRNFLFESYLKVVDEFKPKVFIFENVPGMLSAMPGGVSIVERITHAFAEKGYEISNNLRENALIDCTKFGVPQARKRMVILGVNKKLINENPQIALQDFYKFIFPKYQSKKVLTVKDAIDDLPKLHPLEESIKVGKRNFSHTYDVCEIANHEPRMHSRRDVETFELLTKDIQTGQNKFASVESLKDLYFEITGKRSNIHKYHVLKWNKPSNTIPAHLYKDGLRHIHPDPEQARSITVREAARLQSFDDDFEFLGSLTDQYKMVGNAVPPKFAKAIGLALNDFINKYYA